ncbi:YdhR family protein [Pigmentiphaga soli]|uniref:YdhR family protein n=1 Tax=Pigmentiphaga soli TaxID=1007095 RepID=A0ABP8HMB0_9BURK
MYVTITRFKVSPDIGEAGLTALFEQSAERYAKVAGLLAKHYYIDEGNEAGGVYLWESRADADALFDEAFAQGILQRFGSRPSVHTMWCPVSLDNVHHSVRLAPQR